MMRELSNKAINGSKYENKGMRPVDNTIAGKPSKNIKRNKNNGNSYTKAGSGNKKG